MKKALVFFMVALFSLPTTAQETPKKLKKNKNVVFSVNGNCKMCEKRIEKAAYSIRGVKSAEWHVDCQDIHLIIDERKCNVKDVQQAIANAGHDAGTIRATDEAYENLHHCCSYKRL